MYNAYPGKLITKKSKTTHFLICNNAENTSLPNSILKNFYNIFCLPKT